jgi:endonuclease G
MRLITAIATVFIGFSVWAATPQNPPQPIASCAAQIPYGQPSLKSGDTTVICRKAYILQHDNKAKIPVWVAYTLTYDHAIGCVERSNAFTTDQSLPDGKRSTPADYDHSGYDQGHLANDADMSWNEDVERESFFMSNMSPQLPQVNRGTWKLLETNVRVMAYYSKDKVTVYAGNIYNAQSKTIGHNEVVVPDFLYKIVINHALGISYAFIMPNEANIGPNIRQYQVSVADVERATGLTFPVPDGKSVIAAMPNQDTDGFAKAKKNACHH